MYSYKQLFKHFPKRAVNVIACARSMVCTFWKMWWFLFWFCHCS